jgi:SAM-dependent methyltransferase
MKFIKSINKCYNKLSNFGKILFFLALLLILISIFSVANKEGMINNEKFIYKKDNEIYDDFYANIYDYLVFNNVKNNYEIGNIINTTNPSEYSRIADIGCGTGHHVNELSVRNLNVIGIDISPSMIKKARENYPNSNFEIGDALQSNIFQLNSLTHILCLYFTIYYMKNKKHFFINAYDWLMPGGYLIVHLVDKYKFDPILPPGNPLYIVSPQKYAKDRITTTKITFNDFIYNANFKMIENSDNCIFEEKINFNDGRRIKQEQTLIMEDIGTILNYAQDAGFSLHAKIDMVKCAYENQFLYIFVKPN